jgi:hypothetical protein
MTMSVGVNDIRTARGQTNAGESVGGAGPPSHPDGDAIGGQVGR